MPLVLENEAPDLAVARGAQRLVLFSTSIRVRSPLGPRMRSFSKWKEYPRRMLKPRLPLSCVFFLRVQRRRSFLRSLILGSALIS